jgi:hypothetical protein
MLEAGCTTGIDGVQNPDQVIDVQVAAASLGDSTFDDAALWVSWSRPDGIPSTPQPRGGYVVGYELYRSGSPRASVTPANLIAFIEGGDVTSFIDSADDDRTAEQITVSTNDSTGYVAVNRAPSSGPASASYGADTITYDIVPTPPSPGEIYTYTVRTVTKKLPPQPFPGSSGELSLGGQLKLSTEARSTQATLLEQPILVDPPAAPDPGSRDVDIATTLFSWQAVDSADTYVLEFSTDRSFPEGNTVRSDPYAIIQTEGTVVSQKVNDPAVAEAFRNVTDPIYWRVGARNSSDALYPRDRFGRAVDWVFSASRSFYGIDAPPPAP